MKDYAGSGFTIREALLDQAKASPNAKEHPRRILWRGLRIGTADSIPIPKRGTIRGEFLSSNAKCEHGFDLRLDGWLMLEDGKKVSLLRTWNDPRYEPVVEYRFGSRDGLLWVWNVYKRALPDGRVIEEKWTENAGLWVEEVSERERVYHCSPGFLEEPDFEALVFRLQILGEER